MKPSFVTNSVTAVTVAGLLTLVQTSRAQFAASVVAYNSGTGFQPGYTNPTSALGEPARITPGIFGGPVDPFNPPYLPSQLVSLGTGGFLTVQFSAPIVNDPAHAFGLDFNIFGNAGFIITNSYDENYTVIGTPRTDGTLFGADATATRVSVSSDGINFFTLNPALAPIVDALYPTDGAGDFGLTVNPALSGAAFAGLDLGGIRALYNGAGGGRGYDISWAQDSLGQSVLLASIEFVRIEVLSGNAEIDGFVAVPEPSTLALGFIGVAAGFAARRKTTA